ncbi:hypothetical protein PQQ53_10730 [Paraburkholderia strydomiana]|jgi:hypothetical protein|uniref:Uncharacterized protein n=1 Tax=Paraburkholderia strydomiana TaxID=1245417 RepID=A0ABW9EDE6_9BURK
MSGSNRMNPAARRTPWQKRWYRAGAAVLIGALIAAALIYTSAAPPDDALARYSAVDPRYQIELQRIGGNAAVLMAQLHQWFDGLWHGRALAATVAALGLAAAGACVFIGYFFDDDAPPR